MKNKYPQAHGITLKKQFGQHFLRDQSVVDHMLAQVNLESAAVFEIGCGDGFLTRSILKNPIKLLWVFEIDHDWAQYVATTYKDERMVMFEENILDVDFSRFEPNKPWILLANLPYQITFPLLYKLVKNRDVLREGVVMVQEEVAQKIVKTTGRGYGFHALHLQHYFQWKLLQKISPTAFYPPPKVFSRLLYFKPLTNIEAIPDEEQFWVFVKRSFLQPRRNLKNNLKSYQYDLSLLSEETLNLRAEQLSKKDFLDIWDMLRAKLKN